MSEYHPALQQILTHRAAQSRAFVADLSNRQRDVATREFTFSGALCSDGRLSDNTFALGLRPGQLKAFRDPGSMESSFIDSVYMQRFVAHAKLVKHGLDLVPDRRLGQIHFSMAHYSSSSEALGCGAWSGQTAAYIAHMKKLAAEVNAWEENSRIIALTTLLDTDTDGLTIFGAHGEKLVVSEYAKRDGVSASDELRTKKEDIERSLRFILPEDLAPVSRLDSSIRGAFYSELADRLTANVAFIERVRAEGRPPEALDHQEKAIFLGRPLETRNRNEAFLIEDRGNIFGSNNDGVDDAPCHLQLAFKYVVPNCIAADPENWVVPVFIAIPHSGKDRSLVRRYALGLRRRVQQAANDYAMWVVLNAHDHAFSEDVRRKIGFEADQLPDHLVICTTIHDRRTRMPEPVDDLEDIR